MTSMTVKAITLRKSTWNLPPMAIQELRFDSIKPAVAHVISCEDDGFRIVGVRTVRGPVLLSPSEVESRRLYFEEELLPLPVWVRVQNRLGVTETTVVALECDESERADP